MRNIFIALVCITLFRFAPTPTPQPALTYGEAVTGSIKSDEDVAYTFTGSRDDVIVITVERASDAEKLYPAVSIADAKQRLATTANDRTLVSGTLALRLTNDAAYSITVSARDKGKAENRTGAFLLTLTKAAPLTPGAPVTHDAKYAPKTDARPAWFTFDGGASYTATLERDAKAFGGRATIYSIEQGHLTEQYTLDGGATLRAMSVRFDAAPKTIYLVNIAPSERMDPAPGANYSYKFTLAP